jgi:competence protein ComEC
VKVLRTIASGAHISESRFELAANRIRSALGDGASVLPGDQSSLFAGLVYGDDSQQPPEMVDRFRASGLAHLTAVSGQNVAFILTVAAPFLTRLRRWSRLTLTLLVLAWFAIMTRLEPSVIRAVTMAGISATVFAIGGRLKAWQVLAATSMGLLLVDPFLLWSVGWWLSIGGSSGLILLSSRIRSTLECWGLVNHQWVLNWVVPSLAAQLGVLPIAVMVFGWPSAVAIPCNLLAIPVAGIVMLVGIPVALVSGFLPSVIASVVMWPLGVGVKWVDTVAALGQRFNLPNWLDIAVGLAPLLLMMRHRCDNLET